jgi:type VI secretion system secreted protein Hcp
MPIYMKYGDIKGDVTAKGHEGILGWMEINGFQFGIGRSIASPVGGVSDRESSAPTVSEIVVTKPADISSTALFEQALYGEGVKVQIDFCKTDKGALEVYQSYQLENAMISGLSVSSGGDRPMESISINFTKIQYAFYQMNATGNLDETPKAGWDIALAHHL